MPARTAATRRRARRPAASKASKASARRRRPSARTRRRGSGTGFAIFTAIAVPVALVAAVLMGGGVLAGAFGEAFADDGEPAPVAPAPPPAIVDPSIAGYGLEQLGNACTILTAGRDLGFDQRDRTIAVMTAMGESSLRNIDYGDWETNGVTNPDGSRTTSIGLFQQQDSWGSREARLDPYTAAGIFYRAMAARVPDRAALEPTIVAHRTQINEDPQHYARYWERALRVVAALGGTPPAGERLDGIPLCPAAV